MADPVLVAQVARDTLGRFSLRSAYASEQNDLQPHIQAELETALLRGLSRCQATRGNQRGRNGQAEREDARHELLAGR